MSSNPTPSISPSISTRSVEDGLDFACNLLADALVISSSYKPESSATLLGLLANYISFRYCGEEGLALENLMTIAEELKRSEKVRWAQFWQQIQWLCEKTGVPCANILKK
ncbi:MAG TPA: hypothetical protein VHS31_19530 [Tepidisphaeraceae bacterium]|jgi:hypothetical protein|nr:hypothetical protein [Tepidisphaeraceae bacterium]